MFDIQRGNNTRPLEIKYMLVHNSALLPRELHSGGVSIMVCVLWRKKVRFGYQQIER